MSRPRGVLAWLLFVLVGLGVDVAAAKDPCAGAPGVHWALGDDGLGGTGLGSDGEDGLGGTGLGSGGDDGLGGTGLGSGGEDGLGGTGLTGSGSGGEGEDGMGGTGLQSASLVGVVGTITGIGSICVNGERIAFDANMPVEADGSRRTARDLAVGQVVAVEARRTNHGLRAERISIQHAVVGPVTRVDAKGGRFYVMGKAVQVPSDGFAHSAGARGALDLASVTVGQRVAVSGLHRSDGVLVASRVDAAAAGSGASVSGPVQSLGSGAFAIGEVRVTSERRPGTSLPGYARAVGTWNAERKVLVAERVTPPRVFSERVARASVEGFVRDRRDSGFRLTGLEVDAAAVADRLPAAPGDLRVVVIGSFHDHGKLRAERIWVHEVAGHDHSLLHGTDRQEASDRDDREDREDREDRDDREDREERSGRSERTDRVERAERTDRVERAERPERSERVERSEREDRSDRGGRR